MKKNSITIMPGMKQKKLRAVRSAELENEASLFACLLLMPRRFIEEDLAGINLTDDTKFKEMAKKYDVPLTALSFRIAYFIKHNQ